MIRKLARQGIALRGHTEFKSNFIQMLDLLVEDDPELTGLLVALSPHRRDKKNSFIQPLAG